MEETSTVLTLPEQVVDMIVQLRDQEPGDDEYGLLIEVTGFQGRQFTYDLSFVALDSKSEGHVAEKHGELTVLLREEDLPKLQGASLDLTDQGLAMNNPNAPESPAMAAPKGDLTGPLADQVKQVLDEQVNPAIAGHGGRSELVSVDGTIAYLALGGGCQGCGMAQVTLKHGIERILLEAIPELTEVVDVTDHASGTDPFYESAKK